MDLTTTIETLRKAWNGEVIEITEKNQFQVEIALTRVSVAISEGLISSEEVETKIKLSKF